MSIDSMVEKSPWFTRILVILRMAVCALELRSAEYLLGVVAISTGLWMGWPWNNLYKSDALYYKIMVAYMPEWAWTVGFLVAAAPSVFCTGNGRVCLKVRVYGNALLLAIWVLASTLFTIDQAPYLATAWTPVFSVFQLWILVSVWLKSDNLPQARANTRRFTV